MTRAVAFVVLGLVISVPSLACTCMETPSAREGLGRSSLVFRGTVVKSDKLVERSEMLRRQRYAVTLKVIEYWAGNPGKEVTLYDLDPGTDCMGFGFLVGREYLVFASQGLSKDHRLGSDFWYGWTDVLPPGTPMWEPLSGCSPGGEAGEAEIKRQLRQLRRGKTSSGEHPVK
jgi:hypothetical protein